MAGNHVLLETIELTQNTASVTFDNIPQTGYTDLMIKVSARTIRGSEEDGLYMSFNGLNSDGFIDLESNGTSASSVSTASYGNNWVTRVNGGTSTANIFGNSDIYISDYTSSKQKPISVDGVIENNATLSYTNFTSSLWAYTSPVTSISFGCNANFATGSTFSLYGISSLGTAPTISPRATGGNIVANDGTYWYHAFLRTGTFTPQQSITCDVLQIGAGGGGGSNRGGGGGAGGLRIFTSQALTVNNYVIAVGAGGTGGGGTSGNASQFHNFTVSPGGGRGGNSQGAGLTGASGGGGGNELPQNPTPAGGGATLGNVGGTCNPGDKISSGGGGGGFGSAGGNGVGTSGGVGGAGVNTYSSWATATSTGASGFYAGGGGGYGAGGTGSGGSGGGGTGASGNNNNGSSGITGTGGGGGATSDTGTAYNGGSGIVIIRYAMA
jgi:hypothetical protein